MAWTARHAKRRLGEVLVEEGLVTGAQVQQALERQKTTGELLGEALVQLGCVKEEDIVVAVAKQLGCPYINAARYYVSQEAIALVPVETTLEHRLIPLDRIGRFLLLAVSGDVPAEVLEEIEIRTSLTISLYVSTPKQIVQAIQKNANRLVRLMKEDARTPPAPPADAPPSLAEPGIPAGRVAGPAAAVGPI